MRRGLWGIFLNGKSTGGRVVKSSVEHGVQTIELKNETKIFYEPIRKDGSPYEDDLLELPVQYGDVVAVVFHCHTGIKSKFAVWREGELVLDLWIGPDRFEMEDRLTRDLREFASASEKKAEEE